MKKFLIILLGVIFFVGSGCMTIDVKPEEQDRTFGNILTFDVPPKAESGINPDFSKWDVIEARQVTHDSNYIYVCFHVINPAKTEPKEVHILMAIGAREAWMIGYKYEIGGIRFGYSYDEATDTFVQDGRTGSGGLQVN